MNINMYKLTVMKFFSFTLEICITAIKRYNYAFKQRDTDKELKLIRNFKNKWDTNAIQIINRLDTLKKRTHKYYHLY